LLCAIGHSAEFFYAIWAMVQISVSAVGHGGESLTTVQNHTKFILKLAIIFKGKVRKKWYISIMYYPRQ
jgi:hypothetical protein